MVEPKQVRLNIGFTQAQMAKACGTTISTWTAWEYGERSPSGAAARLLEVLSALNERNLIQWYAQKFME